MILFINHLNDSNYILFYLRVSCFHSEGLKCRGGINQPCRWYDVWCTIWCVRLCCSPFAASAPKAMDSDYCLLHIWIWYKYREQFWGISRFLLCIFLLRTWFMSNVSIEKCVSCSLNCCLLFCFRSILTNWKEYG